MGLEIMEDVLSTPPPHSVSTSSLEWLYDLSVACHWLSPSRSQAEKSTRALWALFCLVHHPRYPPLPDPPNSGHVFRLKWLSGGADAPWRARILHEGERARTHYHAPPVLPMPRTSSTNYTGDRASKGNYWRAAMAPKVRTLKGTLMAAARLEARTPGICGLPGREGGTVRMRASICL